MSTRRGELFIVSMAREDLYKDIIFDMTLK
jgi:hypothetical protein